MTDNGADEVVRGEVVKLVGDVGDDVLKRGVAAGLRRDFVPELVHDGVHALRKLLLAEFAVGEHACDVEDGRTAAWVLHHEQSRVAEILFEGRTHALRYRAVEAMEDGEKLVNDEGLLLRARHIVFEEVERERAREVGGVEINDVFIALGWHRSEHIEDVGAVRVDETASLASLDVLHNHGLHESSFAGPRLTNDVKMAQAVLGIEIDAGGLSAVRIHAEKRTCLRERKRRGGVREARLLQVRRALDARRREVIDSSELAQRERERRIIR